MKRVNTMNQKVVYSLPVISVIAALVIFIFMKFPTTDINSAREILSTLVQCEATIIALAITVSLVAVQLTANSYSPRVSEIFMSDCVPWLITGIYIISMLYTLFVLRMIKTCSGTSLIVYIYPCYLLGVLCFTLLIVYIYRMFTTLQTSEIIERILRKAKKGNLDSFEKNTVQPMIDLLQGSFTKNDFETIRKGLKRFSEFISEIFRENNIKLSEKDFSDAIFPYFLKFCNRVTKKRDKEVTLGIISMIGEIGRTAAENWNKSGRVISERSVSVLGEIEIAAIKGDFGEVAIPAGDELKEIGKISVREGFIDTARMASRYLEEIWRVSVEETNDETAKQAISNLKEMGVVAVEKDCGDAISGIASSFRRIGRKAIEEKYEEYAREVARSLTKMLDVVEEGLRWIQ